MQTYIHNGYTFALDEMSRRAQVACIAELNRRIGALAELDDIQRMAAITTLILLRSRLTVTAPDGSVLPPGDHDLGGAVLTLPLTEACVNDVLPASLTGWMITASAEENLYTLQSFLAGLSQATTTKSA